MNRAGRWYTFCDVLYDLCDDLTLLSLIGGFSTDYQYFSIVCSCQDFAVLSPAADGI